ASAGTTSTVDSIVATLRRANLVIEYLRVASHAPSYEQTLAAVLKFPITSFTPLLSPPMATTTLLENLRCKDFEYRYSNIGLVIEGSVTGVSGKTPKASQPSPWAETLFLADRIEALGSQATAKVCATP